MSFKKKAKNIVIPLLTRWRTKYTFMKPTRQLRSEAETDNRKEDPETPPEVKCPEKTTGGVERIRPSQLEGDRLAADLDGCAEAMQLACKRVETEFLNIGERLQTICSQAMQLSHNAQHAVEHIGSGGTAQILLNITQAARQALTEFGRKQAAIQDCLEYIRTIEHHLLGLHGMIPGLHGIAKTLKMVAVNISIESSRSAESHENFLVLAREIRALSDTVANAARTLADETKVAAANLGTMHQTMGAKLCHFQQLAKDSHIAVDRTAPMVQGLIDRAMDVLHHVADHARTLSQNAGEIVMNLQIHDSISQRIDHIVHALAEVRHSFLQAGDGNETLRLVDGNLMLQQAQLRSIVEDIDSAYQQSTHAFDTIGRSVQDITARLVGISSGIAHDQNSGQGGASSIGSLQSTLDKIQQLIAEGGRTVRELEAIAQQAAETVARIAQHMQQVRDVNFDIHLKALNAILKSVRLGNQGKAIAVLVQEMKDLAIQSNALVEQVEVINKATMEDAGALQARINVERNIGGRTDDVDCIDLKAGIKEFDAVGITFIQTADNTTQLCGNLTDQIKAAASQLCFLRPFAGQLQEQLQQLDRLRAELIPWTGNSQSSVMLNQESFVARYTMKHERDVHAAALGPMDFADMPPVTDRSDGGRATAESQTLSEQGSDESADNSLGDNVELF